MPVGQRDEGARRLVLAALAAGASVSGAARAAGCSRSTVYGWAARGDAVVAQALTDRRQVSAGLPEPAAPELEPEPEPEPVEAGLRRLALKVLTRIAADENARTADRVAAAGRLAALCGSPRRTTPAAAPDPLPPSESRPELSAEDATKRFRVVS